MSEVRGGTGARGNPPPRRALSRVRPLEAGDGPGSAVDPTAAAAPGGTEGRDLLIPGHLQSPPGDPRSPGNQPGKSQARAKNGRPVPSLADLMPPAAPSGRRHGEGHGAHHKPSHGKTAHHKADDRKADDRKADDGKVSDKNADRGGKSAELSVRLSKPVRKALKARAAELGLSPEETVAQLVEVWLEG